MKAHASIQCKYSYLPIKLSVLSHVDREIVHTTLCTQLAAESHLDLIDRVVLLDALVVHLLRRALALGHLVAVLGSAECRSAHICSAHGIVAHLHLGGHALVI